MNQTAPVRLIRILSWIIALIIFLLPFHAFLTIWLSSLVGHYTLIRLWKEFLLVFLLAGSLFLLAVDKSLRQRFWQFWPARLTVTYAALFLVWAVVAWLKHDVPAKAMWYGLLVNLRFLVFFLVAWVVASKSDWLSRQWQKMLIAQAVAVAVFAVLQFTVLPYDFLRHFGYGPNTISPYETINHNLHHLRVESTLRGANPLGAYMIVPLSALAVLVIKYKSRRWAKVGLSCLMALALVFSFSRSAWIGAGLSLLVIAWLSLKISTTKNAVCLSLLALALVGASLSVALRNNTEFENVFLHTEHNSSSAISSNQGHSAAFKAAVHDIVHQPLGGGVGTAGPESVYNNQQVRIAENYFLQIGQEVGVIGMLLFIAICLSVGQQLWLRRADSLAICLLASLVGLSLVNLLSHAWTDDTLAYIWWGLAGIACAPAILTDKRKQKNGQKNQTT